MLKGKINQSTLSIISSNVIRTKQKFNENEKKKKITATN